MNLDHASKSLREAVRGREPDLPGMKRTPGLLEVVQARVQGPEREEMLVLLGRILGVADALAGYRLER